MRSTTAGATIKYVEQSSTYQMDQPPSPDKNNLTPGRVSQRIAAGECPQDLLTELVALSQTDRFNPIDLIYPLLILVKNGASVATNEKGCAFELLIRDPATAHTLLYSSAMDEMLETPGQIPLHLMARDSPKHLSSPLSIDIPGPILNGLHKLDAMGRTPAHWLWTPDSSLAELAAQKDQSSGAQSEWMGTVLRAWEVQELMCKAGLKMDIPDNQGATALDLCIERLRAGQAIMIPEQEFCQQIQAQWERMDMELATPRASTAKTSTARF